MGGDNLEAVRAEAATFQGQPLTHAWDPDRQVSDLFAKTLKLRGTAWDVYLLYPRGVRWDANEPPPPEFWMHQLPTATGADAQLLFQPSSLARETLHLLGNGAVESHPDLGLRLHAKSLAALLQRRDAYSLEEITEATKIL